MSIAPPSPVTTHPATSAAADPLGAEIALIREIEAASPDSPAVHELKQKLQGRNSAIAGVCDVLLEAIHHVERANAKGDPILLDWIHDAQAALASTKGKIAAYKPVRWLDVVVDCLGVIAQERWLVPPVKHNASNARFGPLKARFAAQAWHRIAPNSQQIRRSSCPMNKPTNSLNRINRAIPSSLCPLIDALAAFVAANGLAAEPAASGDASVDRSTPIPLLSTGAKAPHRASK